MHSIDPTCQNKITSTLVITFLCLFNEQQQSKTLPLELVQ